MFSGKHRAKPKFGEGVSDIVYTVPYLKGVRVSIKSGYRDNQNLNRVI